MEVNVIIGLDADTKGIAQKFLEVLEGRLVKREEGAPAMKPLAPEEVSDVKMAEVQEEVQEEIKNVEEVPEKTVDYSSLRKEIKQLGIKLVRAKKQKEVKALTTKYGYAKIDELPDSELESYLAELKEI